MSSFKFARKQNILYFLESKMSNESNHRRLEQIIRQLLSFVLYINFSIFLYFISTAVPLKILILFSSECKEGDWSCDDPPTGKNA